MPFCLNFCTNISFLVITLWGLGLKKRKENEMKGVNYLFRKLFVFKNKFYL